MLTAYSTIITVFPRNIAAARFYFKALYHAATIRGRLDFEGGVYGDQYARVYTVSIMSLLNLYARIMHMRVRISSLTPYHAATFRGRWDFEEIWYSVVNLFVQSGAATSLEGSSFS